MQVIMEMEEYQNMRQEVGLVRAANSYLEEILKVAQEWDRNISGYHRLAPTMSEILFEYRRLREELGNRGREARSEAQGSDGESQGANND